ncbi:hypothetical protein BLNAU_17676 [Blattamonas nauphoetae]|uniref:Uncharacterized protein n=1 Tax=Blattamonas nauphoetae TaxID=2049346 RepID=A0ABQ9X6W2_9EUKA|nr:hypothetical protein BLNAU_17676 [Blattamonas nauphoetae]
MKPLQDQLKQEQSQNTQLRNQLKQDQAALANEKDRSVQQRDHLNAERTARQREKEEAAKTQNELKRKIEELEAMLRTAQQTRKGDREEGRMGTEQRMVGQQVETAEEQVVRSRSGAAAIEWFTPDGSSLTGSVFSHFEGECTTLLSFSCGKVVARFTFTFRRFSKWTAVGIVASSQTEKVKGGGYFPSLLGGAGWNVHKQWRDTCQNGKKSSSGSACKAGAAGQRVVLEADGRDGKRTLRLSQNGQTQPTFFSLIPFPFRFAIILYGRYDNVEIESVEELTEPTMTGGTTEIRMDE